MWAYGINTARPGRRNIDRASYAGIHGGVSAPRFLMVFMAIADDATERKGRDVIDDNYYRSARRADLDWTVIRLPELRAHLCISC